MSTEASAEWIVIDGVVMPYLVEIAPTANDVFCRWSDLRKEALGYPTEAAARATANRIDSSLRVELRGEVTCPGCGKDF